MKKAILQDGLRPTIPGNVPAEIVSLMQGCWEHDAQRRPTFNMIVKVLANAMEAQVERSSPLHAASGLPQTEKLTDRGSFGKLSGSVGLDERGRVGKGGERKVERGEWRAPLSGATTKGHSRKLSMRNIPQEVRRKASDVRVLILMIAQIYEHLHGMNYSENNLLFLKSHLSLFSLPLPLSRSSLSFSFEPSERSIFCPSPFTSTSDEPSLSIPRHPFSSSC